MNKVTRDIMKLFSISDSYALVVQEQMEKNGVNFSECSEREFKAAARAAIKQVDGFETKKRGNVVAIVSDNFVEVRQDNDDVVLILKCDGALHASLVARAISDGVCSFDTRVE